MVTIFTKIISKEIPSRIVMESKKYLAILDSSPWTKGHTLVIPKEEYRSVLDLPPNFQKDIMVFSIEVAKLLQDKLKCPSFTFMINDGPLAGQEVPHVYVHVIPRYNKKEILVDHKKHNDNLDKVLSLLKF